MAGAENPYVGLELFSKYMAISLSDRDELFALYLNAAQEVIERHIGYTLAKCEYRHRVSGMGSQRIILKAFPVFDIVFEDTCCAAIDVKKNIITLASCLEKNKTVGVRYTAGYTSETLPELFRLTIMRIAALMVSEESGDIAITGKNFGDEGGRTFISTRDYTRLLNVLDSYRII